MLIALIVIATVLALAVALPVADRTLAALAERRAAEVLATPLLAPATVRVLGKPFVAQALRGRYREVEVRATVPLGDIAGVALVAQLRNVYLPLRDLLSRRVRGLPCERVLAQLVVPYPELARASRIPGLSLSFDGQRLLAAAALPVPGLGQLARVTGEARLRLSGDAVWLSVRDLGVAGIPLPSLVLGQLAPTLNVPVTLPALPYGLRLDELRPAETGLLVAGSADAVVLRAPG